LGRLWGGFGFGEALGRRKEATRQKQEERRKKQHERRKNKKVYIQTPDQPHYAAPY